MNFPSAILPLAGLFAICLQGTNAALSTPPVSTSPQSPITPSMMTSVYTRALSPAITLYPKIPEYLTTDNCEIATAAGCQENASFSWVFDTETSCIQCPIMVALELRATMTGTKARLRQLQSGGTSDVNSTTTSETPPTVAEAPLLTLTGTTIASITTPPNFSTLKDLPPSDASLHSSESTSSLSQITTPSTQDASADPSKSALNVSPITTLSTEDTYSPRSTSNPSLITTLLTQHTSADSPKSILSVFPVTTPSTENTLADSSGSILNLSQMTTLSTQAAGASLTKETSLALSQSTLPPLSMSSASYSEYLASFVASVAVNNVPTSPIDEVLLSKISIWTIGPASPAKSSTKMKTG